MAEGVGSSGRWKAQTAMKIPAMKMQPETKGWRKTPARSMMRSRMILKPILRLFILGLVTDKEEGVLMCV